jgi:hypothetical protein
VSDAAVVDEVLDLLRSDPDWSEASLSTTLEQRGWCFPDVTSSIGDHTGTVVWELTFELWELDLDDEGHDDYDKLEALAKPRMDALGALFAQRAEGWLPGAIAVPELDEWYPYGYSRGWHTGTRSVEIGYLVHDNGLPLMVSLRAYDNPKQLTS